jgi:methylated-DNA-[protein]-cysteine S-methyltransferase
LIRIHVVAIPLPKGPIWIAGTRDGVYRLGFGAAPSVPAHTALANRGVCRISRRAGPLTGAVDWLRSFASGADPGPTPALDLDVPGAFTRRVLEVIASIPLGQVQTYDDIAHRLGSPRSARAVGQALAANPLPILIPCHRVVKKHGEIGDYIGGRAWKQFLLDLEGDQLGLAIGRRRRASKRNGG